MVVCMFPNIQHLSFIKENSKKLHMLASTASNREDTKYQWKMGFLIIYSTKRDQYCSFWCQEWSDHQDQEVFWRNWAVEAVEASEVSEATEVNEAGEVSKAWKITTEDFRVIQFLEFNDLSTNITLF